MKDDAISRWDAISCLNGELTIIGYKNREAVSDYVQKVAKKLNDLPSVKQTGEWITRWEAEWGYGASKHFYCSECNSEAFDLYEFCPHCGVRMKR